MSDQSSQEAVPTLCLDAIPLDLSVSLPCLYDHEASLPLPVDRIPPHVESLTDCAAHQIQRLEQQKSWTTAEEDALDDGFFLCDLQTVQAKLDVWRRHLFPSVKPFYALKCHPDPMVAAILGRQHSTGPAVTAAGFDCASIAEIQLALASTAHDTRQIIYANPQRAEDALEQALQLGVRVLTFDGAEELYKVQRIYTERIMTNSQVDSNSVPPQMVLRILVPDEHSSVPLGEKFGAPPDQWINLMQLAVDLHLPVVGVSFHCGSGNHDPASYVQAIRLAKEALETIERVQATPKPWLLDIGGGYPGFDGCGGDDNRFTHREGRAGMEPIVRSSNGQSSKDDSTAQIAQAVTPFLNELFAHKMKELHFVAEPGRYFVEAAFALCSRIYKVKAVHDENDQVHYHYFIAHGVQGVFKDILLCGESFTPQALPIVSAEKLCTDVFASTVHGPSGHDYDVVCPTVTLPRLDVGDWLIFDRMGAYTFSIASRSGQPPVRYVV